MIELVEGCHQKSRPTHTRQADLNKICDRRLKTLGIVASPKPDMHELNIWFSYVLI